MTGEKPDPVSSDKMPSCSKTNPEECARWYSFIGAFWLTGFIKEAAKKPLQFDDLFPLHANFQTHNSTDRVMKSIELFINLDEFRCGKDEVVAGCEVKKLTDRENRIKWALLKGILYSERQKIVCAVLLHAVKLIAQLLTPIFLAGLLNAPILSKEAYTMVAGLFICQMFLALSWNNSQYISRGAAMSIKAALLSMIYKKALRLGTVGRAKYPAGVVMNMVASDCNIIQDSIQYFSDLCIMPLEIISLSVLVIWFVGPAGAAGLACMIICVAASTAISSMAIKFERKALDATDQRIKMTGEIINGIKILKFFAWESPFFERLTLLREVELKQHIKLRMIGASFSAIMNILPSFVNVITFAVYTSLGNSITAAKIFSTLSIVNLIKLPIAMTPMIMQLSSWIVSFRVIFADVFFSSPNRMSWTSMVSLERLAKFFAMEEIQEEPLSGATCEGDLNGNAIALDKATFQWATAVNSKQKEAKQLSDSGSTLCNSNSEEMDRDSCTSVDAFQLNEICLCVKKGSLTLIVGKVGSGKSSLVQSLIGGTILVAGSSKVRSPRFSHSWLTIAGLQLSGKLGYSPQASWLQNDTLRANILFGALFDEERYNKVIQCCGLAKDLQLLPHGDMSHIGEKGDALSGGQAARVNLARAVYSNADILLLVRPHTITDAESKI
ncbi:hypothetical protein HDU98_008057 [Podochytrium sp. JEL0797]|nr:hypothetical protein HDU98_008057 [Podochytrium sp. JEL0797]